jgi:uncharacterized protein (TIGR02597 family)
MKASAITAAALLALTAQTVSAAETVGYNVVTVPANSDVLVSVPFNNNAEATFTVTSVDGTGITVNEALSADTYDSGYYVRFIDGSGEGLWSTITDNGSGGLTLADDLSGYVANGNTFRVYAHHTLETVFPDGLESVSFAESSSAFVRKTEILVPDASSTGINKPAAATYYYLNDEWRKVGASGNFDDVVLSPDEYFILRNTGGAGELDYIVSGDVESGAIARIIPTGDQNDVIIVSGRPVPMTLAELGLGGTAAFETSASAFVREDELLVFDNSTADLNKPAAATYYYLDGEWRKVGASGSFDDAVVDAGAAMIIRKASGDAGSDLWSQQANF